MTDTARVYGGSLYELAAEEGLAERLLEELRAAVRLFRENPEYEALMNVPSVPREERLGALDQAFGGRVHPYLVNFLKLLTERGSISQLSGTLAAFEGRYNEDNGILTVEVVSAAPLSAADRAALTQKLATLTGKKPRLTCTLDPQVLGGLRLTMDGKRYDGTVRARLDEIERSLKNKIL